jgi:hypothetical protein
MICLAESDFKGYREMANTEEKKIYIVDSGLSFNLPFPILLRSVLSMNSILKGQCHEMVVEVRPWSGRLGLN